MVKRLRHVSQTEACRFFTWIIDKSIVRKAYDQSIQGTVTAGTNIRQTAALIRSMTSSRI